MVAALYFLDFMLKTGKTPGQLLEFLYSKVGPHYYDRDDFPISPEKHKETMERIKRASPKEIAGLKVAKLDTEDGFRFVLEDDSWLLIRFSGTEPLIRVYSEADSEDKIKKFLAAGKLLIGA